MAEYTRCRLTFPSDKLPALSGLASIFKRNTGYTYLAGLWEEDFINGLLWFAPMEQGQPVEGSVYTYRGPSWSWVSTDLAVRNMIFTIQNEFPAHSMSDIELVNSYVKHIGPNSMGKIARAIITVQAYMQRLSYKREDGTRRCSIFDINGQLCGNGILDATDDETGVRKECAGIWVTERRFKMYDPEVPVPATYILYFLIVVPVPDTMTENCWRRIGLGWTPRWQVIFAFEKSNIGLV